MLAQLWADKSMVFLMGPRQSGKTTFAKGIAGERGASLYFNWDLITDKRKLLADPLFFQNLDRVPGEQPLVIFDELHKYKHWKNYLKGVFDGFGRDFSFLVLGSGRLDVYKKGGDSLAGRYLQLHMWPLTCSELAFSEKLIAPRPFADFWRGPLEVEPKKQTQAYWQSLAQLSGFPEPYFSQRKSTYRRWSINYRQRLVREDVRDTSKVHDIESVEGLFSLLPSRVGAALSVSNLARDLQVSFNSVKNWLELFDNFYLSFRITPWTPKVSRALSKEKKLYLFDYGAIEEPGARFENMVALELWRAVWAWNDLGLGEFSLHYVRNKEQQEVDFLIADKRRPKLLVECKLSDTAPAKALLKFQSMLGVPAVQLVEQAGVARRIRSDKHEVLVASAAAWVAGLPLGSV
jgi:predicted AAA+ superfamily ATPase